MMFQFCCVIAEARWSRDSLYLSYSLCLLHKAAVSGDVVSIHTGSGVGRLCVVVEDLLEIRERGI